MLFFHQGTNRLMINSHKKNFPWPKGKKPQKEFREMTKFVFLRVSLPRAAPSLEGRRQLTFQTNTQKTSFLLTLCIFIKLVKKTHLFWVSMCLARKWYSKTLILIVLLETGPPFYVVIRTTRRSSRFAGHDFGHRKCIKVQVCFGNCVITSLRCFSYYTVTKTNLNFLCVS